MILTKIKNRARSWRPLVLHWRRRRSVRPISKVDRVSSPVSISYFPQIHLHFTTHLTQNHSSSLTRVSAGPTVNRERVLRECRLETRMNTDKEPRFPVAYRPLRIRYVNTPTFSKHVNFYALTIPSAPIPNQIQQPRASVSLKSVSSLALHTRHAELTKVFRTHSHISERRTQVLSYRSASHETIFKTDRAEELVWRRTQPRTTVIEDVPVANVTQSTQQQTVRTPAVSTHVQSATASSTQTTPPQITKLDPGLIDRLTDDVIRRVEKRALIERQRRGL